jgi:hypothetical protein
VVLYNWIVCPHLGYLHAMQRLEPVLSHVADKLDMMSGVRDEKLSRLRMLERQLAEVQTGFFTAGEARQFIHDLQDLVETAGCTLATAVFTQEDGAAVWAESDTPEAVQSFRLHATIVGRHEQIVKVLEGLQERRQRVRVEFCRLDLLDPGIGRLELQVGLGIHVISPPGVPEETARRADDPESVQSSRSDVVQDNHARRRIKGE